MLVLWFIIFVNPLKHRCYSADRCYSGVKVWGPFSFSLQSTDVMVQRSLLLVVHRCYCVDYTDLVFSSGMANRTLFQMCGRLYLSMFLLRVGLLTLMYMASLMALAIF